MLVALRAPKNLGSSPSRMTGPKPEARIRVRVFPSNSATTKPQPAEAAVRSLAGMPEPSHEISMWGRGESKRCRLRGAWWRGGKRVQAGAPGEAYADSRRVRGRVGDIGGAWGVGSVKCSGREGWGGRACGGGYDRCRCVRTIGHGGHGDGVPLVVGMVSGVSGGVGVVGAGGF